MAAACGFGVIFDKMKKISTDEQYKKILETAAAIHSISEFNEEKNKLCDQLQVELELFADRISSVDLPLVRKIITIDMGEYGMWLSLSSSKDGSLEITFFNHEVMV